MNEFGQAIGNPLAGPVECPAPSADRLPGRSASMVALSADEHAGDLWRAFEAAPRSLWTYLFLDPFVDRFDVEAWIGEIVGNAGFVPYAVEVDGLAVGFASYMRIEQRVGVIEIGSIAFSGALQRSTASTEALFLMIDHVFELGYRRCEWKCDDLNLPSRSAAERLGFVYEGTFRKATHYKGRSRDTAWFAIVDDDWPDVRASFVEWLAADNFDDAGTQLRSLQQIRSARS